MLADFKKESPGGGSFSLLNQAPHPNAAKVFINWFLSRKGQIALAETRRHRRSANSRRIDIPEDDVPPTNRLAPDGKYFDVVKPEYSDLKPIADWTKKSWPPSKPSARRDLLFPDGLASSASR